MLRPGTALEPPHNLDAEQALLALLLANNLAYEHVFEILTPDDFYHPVLGQIYDAIARTVESGHRADAITLRRLFQTDENFARMGGVEYLTQLTGSFVSVVNARDYALVIHDNATRRKLLQNAQEQIEIALREDVPYPVSENIIQQAEEKLFALAEHSAPPAASCTADLFKETVQRIDAAQKSGAAQGVTTGIPCLEEKLGRLQKAWLYILGARPSMGKTAMGLTLAINAAISGAKIMFCTLEMPRHAIMGRLIARLSGIPATKQRDLLGSDDLTRIMECREEISSWSLHVDDTAALTVPMLRGRCIRHKRRYGLDLVVVDYLGLMGSPNAHPNENLRIQEISRGLKELAKEIDVPVLVLVQLNRALEGRDDKRPQLSDLRDSGAIEQDADVVMFIHREEYYLVRGEPKIGPKESDEKFAERCSRHENTLEKSRKRAELFIAKFRDGETGLVHLAFHGWRCLFFDPAEEAKYEVRR